MAWFHTELIEWQDLLLRIGFALIAGLLIGIERELSNHQAGMKTHVLVCLGSALASLISYEMGLELVGNIEAFRVDMSRIAAGVITGIGFVGAGAIIKGRGGYVAGITTAATLWFSACLGLAIGMGYFKISAVTFAVMYISNITLKLFEKKFINRRGIRCVEIAMTDQRALVDFIKTYCDDRKIKIVSHEYIGNKNDKDENGDRIYRGRYLLWLPRRIDITRVVRDWYMQDYVVEVCEIGQSSAERRLHMKGKTIDFEEPS